MQLSRAGSGEWDLLAPLLPRAVTGRPKVDDRQVINGMICKIHTGLPWRDLPDRYGPWQTVHTRFPRYALSGVFAQSLQQIQAHADAAGDIDFRVGLHIAGASSSGPLADPCEPT